MNKVAIVMPSWNNDEMRRQALYTLTKNTKHPVDIYQFPEKKNYGWMGGCNLGLEATKEHEYVILANDDILCPNTNDWLDEMIKTMEFNPQIGALSVLTMNAMGWQKLDYNTCMSIYPYEVPYCSFFFVMLRRSMIDKVGLLDPDLPGGDDLDYCLRIKQGGYKIAVTPKVFIWHYYAQTGKRVFGEYWDSKEHSEKINKALIQKHGFKNFIYNAHSTEAVK